MDEHKPAGCMVCSQDAVYVLRSEDAEAAFCADHYADNRDALDAGGWELVEQPVAEVDDTDETGPIPVVVERHAIVVNTADGYEEHLLDEEGRFHDDGSVAGYRRFAGGAMVEFKRFQHGVLTDIDVNHPAMARYAYDPSAGVYLSQVCRFTDGLLNDDVTDSGRLAYANVVLDPHGSALLIESWRNGTYVGRIEPSSMPSD